MAGVYIMEKISADVIWGKKYEKAKRKRWKMWKKRERKRKKGEKNYKRGSKREINAK
jgi:hypothetical protein